MTLGPEDDTRGMACGGTTTHIDFAYVRPGIDIQPVIEQRAARWKGNSYVDYAFHLTLAGSPADPTSSTRSRRRSRRDTPASRSSPPTCCRRIPSARATASTSGASTSRWRRSRRRAASWWCTARTRISSSSTTSGSARRDAWRAATSISSTPSSPRTARLPAHDRAGQRDRGRRLLRPHLGARGRGGDRGGARRSGLPVYGETLHQYACFNAEYYKTPRGFCSHTYPSLKFPEDQAGALGRARARRALHPRHRRVPDQPRAEARGAHHRGRHRRQRGRRGAHGHRLHRGRGQARHVARPLRRRHRHQRGADPRPLPEEGRHRPGQRRRPRAHRPDDQQDARQRRLPRDRLQPLGRLGGLGLAGHDPAARQGHRGARPAARQPERRSIGVAARSSPPCSAARPAELASRSCPAPPITPHQFNPGFRLDPAAGRAGGGGHAVRERRRATRASAAC